MKNLILLELETLTNQGRFEELVDLYIATYLQIQPDAEHLRKIKKKVLKKLNTRQASLPKADLTKIKLNVMDSELWLQLNMVQNELTRTIILLVTYMVKHGNDANVKEIFRWVKQQQKLSPAALQKSPENGVGTNPVR